MNSEFGTALSYTLRTSNLQTTGSSPKWKEEKKRNVVKQRAFSSRRQKKFLEPSLWFWSVLCVFLSHCVTAIGLATHADVPGGLSRVPAPRRNAWNLWEATIEFDCWITTDLFRVLHAVDSVNVKQELGFKNKAILYHVDISRGGILPYMGYIGTCRGIGYGFWGSRSLNRVSFFTLLFLCPWCGP